MHNSTKKVKINIPGITGHNKKTGNLACFIPDVKRFEIKSFFYAASDLWNTISPIVQVITDR